MQRRRRGVGRLVEALAQGFAFAGGIVLVAITLMSVASIVGRAVFGAPVQGDFELVQVGCAMGLAAFLPWCQMRRGNIIVDFFSTGLPSHMQARLDAFGAFLVGLVMLAVCWRTAAGALAVLSAGETTMIIGLPVWIGYAAMVPSLAMTAVAGLYTAYESWSEAKGLAT